jgi:hypothetical protein
LDSYRLFMLLPKLSRLGSGPDHSHVVTCAG